MQFAIASLFIAAGLAATANASYWYPGNPCYTNAQVVCSDDTSVEQILVCAETGEGLAFKFQSSCPAGTVCAFDSNQNLAWCGAA